MAYSTILRRLREQKTNYKKRGTMLMGKRDFITVNITNENTQVQIMKPGMTGDKVLASAHSRYLLEKGWKGSRKSVPAAYLTGYLAGKKALSEGAKDAILYTGTRKYTQRMAAALKGVIDAGVTVPANAETFPPDERINGEHLTVKNEVSKIKSAIDSEVK
ncbi:MAG: 50S ribosomal protein L18 [Nitrosopumilus sp.]|uniref:50S ribosomal protein L18 n=1 Tax=Nitrosopumilus sp. TaxID=2024843 RepID=UPI00242DECF9|nr:50S ribosomal protein L18 [Nitrosopumilus sp.]MCV0367337.1 50S ribosomal protein L18 [Nitrosopumilus sp.]